MIMRVCVGVHIYVERILLYDDSVVNSTILNCSPVCPLVVNVSVLQYAYGYWLPTFRVLFCRCCVRYLRLDSMGWSRIPVVDLCM